MAGSIIPATPSGTVLEEQRLGKNDTTLTEFDSTAEPQIIGNFEVAGSLASFASAESITGWAGLSNGTVYVKTVPNTGAGTITAEFTSTAPTWDDTKMGWYGTGANANHRYLYRLTKGGASSYENKRRLNDTGDSIEFAYGADQDLTTDSVVLFSGIKGNYIELIGGAYTAGDAYTAFAQYMTEDGYYKINGLRLGSGIFLFAVKSATSIQFRFSTGTNYLQFTFTQGSSTVIPDSIYAVV